VESIVKSQGTRVREKKKVHTREEEGGGVRKKLCSTFNKPDGGVSNNFYRMKGGERNSSLMHPCRRERKKHGSCRLWVSPAVPAAVKKKQKQKPEIGKRQEPWLCSLKGESTLWRKREKGRKF